MKYPILIFITLLFLSSGFSLTFNQWTANWSNWKNYTVYTPDQYSRESWYIFNVSSGNIGTNCTKEIRALLYNGTNYNEINSEALSGKGIGTETGNWCEVLTYFGVTNSSLANATHAANNTQGLVVLYNNSVAVAPVYSSSLNYNIATNNITNKYFAMNITPDMTTFKDYRIWCNDSGTMNPIGYFNPMTWSGGDLSGYSANSTTVLYDGKFRKIIQSKFTPTSTNTQANIIVNFTFYEGISNIYWNASFEVIGTSNIGLGGLIGLSGVDAWEGAGTSKNGTVAMEYFDNTSIDYNLGVAAHDQEFKWMTKFAQGNHTMSSHIFNYTLPITYAWSDTTQYGGWLFNGYNHNLDTYGNYTGTGMFRITEANTELNESYAQEQWYSTKNGLKMSANAEGEPAAPSASVILNVSIQGPANNTWNNTRAQNFTFIPILEGSTYSNCSIWSNVTGTWGHTWNNTIAIVNNTLNGINYTLPIDGPITWNIQCAAGTDTNFSANNFTIKIDTTAPSAPSSLVNNSQYSTWENVSWTASTDGSSGIETYLVFRNSTNVANTTELSYNFTSLSEYTSYNITIGVKDNTGNFGANSTPLITRTYDVTVPTTPANILNVTQRDTWANYTYDAATDTGSGIEFYLLYRNGTNIANVTILSYNDTALAEYTSYNITVAAKDNSGNYGNNATPLIFRTYDVTAPSQVTGLTNTTQYATWINNSWNAATDGGSGVAGYRIYRNGTSIATTNQLSYNNTGLTEYTSYVYLVSAYDSSGNYGANSTALTTRTYDITAPATVNFTNASMMMSTNWTYLYWSTSNDSGSGINKYFIYRNGTNVANTTNTYYNNTALTLNNTYNFTISTADNSGNFGKNATPIILRTFVDYGLPTNCVQNTTHQDYIRVNDTWLYLNCNLNLTNPNGVNFHNYAYIHTSTTKNNTFSGNNTIYLLSFLANETKEITPFFRITLNISNNETFSGDHKLIKINTTYVDTQTNITFAYNYSTGWASYQLFNCSMKSDESLCMWSSSLHFGASATELLRTGDSLDSAIYYLLYYSTESSGGGSSVGVGGTSLPINVTIPKPEIFITPSEIKYEMYIGDYVSEKIWVYNDYEKPILIKLNSLAKWVTIISPPIYVNGKSNVSFDVMIYGQEVESNTYIQILAQKENITKIVNISVSPAGLAFETAKVVQSAKQLLNEPSPLNIGDTQVPYIYFVIGFALTLFIFLFWLGAKNWSYLTLAVFIILLILKLIFDFGVIY